MFYRASHSRSVYLGSVDAERITMKKDWQEAKKRASKAQKNTCLDPILRAMIPAATISRPLTTQRRTRCDAFSTHTAVSIIHTLHIYAPSRVVTAIFGPFSCWKRRHIGCRLGSPKHNITDVHKIIFGVMSTLLIFAFRLDSLCQIPFFLAFPTCPARIVASDDRAPTRCCTISS